jgi:hypothetical protein
LEFLDGNTGLTTTIPVINTKTVIYLAYNITMEFVGVNNDR